MGIGGVFRRLGRIRIGVGAPDPSELPPPPPAEAERIALRDALSAQLDAAGMPVAPIEDPAAWRERAKAERTARDAARVPYLSPGRVPARVTRIATDARDQWADVCRVLAETGLAARPDRVFGVYRVPDHIDGRAGLQRIVEWDIVHAADHGPGGPTPPPGVVRFDAGEPWVARGVGERRPLDEDLAIAVLARVGIGPERCLGIARDLRTREISAKPGGGTHEILASVTGVAAFVPGDAVERVRSAAVAPVAVPAGDPPGCRIAVLDWWAIHRAVQPARRRWAPLPSPVPHLPRSAPELLLAYLDIVGIDPADCYGVDVTYDDPTTLGARDPRGKWMQSVSAGDEVICADGTPRTRWAGGADIVIAYRDDPRYEEGRARFAAYAAEVIGGPLERSAGRRAPVPKPPSALARAAGGAAAAADVVVGHGITFDGEAPPRYCWPPVG